MRHALTLGHSRDLGSVFFFLVLFFFFCRLFVAFGRLWVSGGSCCHFLEPLARTNGDTAFEQWNKFAADLCKSPTSFISLFVAASQSAYWMLPLSRPPLPNPPLHYLLAFFSFIGFFFLAAFDAVMWPKLLVACVSERYKTAIHSANFRSLWMEQPTRGC